MDGLDELSQAAVLKSPTLNLAHTELAERYIQGHRVLHWAQCLCVDLTTAQVKTSISQAWELGVREAVLAGIILAVSLEDAETASEARMLKLFPQWQEQSCEEIEVRDQL